MRFKPLADGSQSIYLDIYRNGKRQYEFLKMYLIPETDYTAKARNDATLAAANAIKSQRIIELTNNEAGLRNTSVRSKMKLLDWMKHYQETQKKRGVRDEKLIRNTIHILTVYCPKATMRQINKEFLKDLIDYLRNVHKTPQGKPLAANTCINYLACLRNAFNLAVREDVLPENPMNRLTVAEKIKSPESKREYLTLEEVKLLEQTLCKREDIKQAFLFSCYTGLRISDVHALQWKNVTEDNGRWRINIVMEKTKDPLYLPLSKQALKWMPKRGEAADEDRVFPTVPREISSPTYIHDWVKAAGITKHISYHCSRHTCATMLLTLGADIYTVSKLLGHRRVETTQIYAKIINKKKDDAVSLIDAAFADA